ncbi:Z-ring formation inhibitor MciZ [Heyndrickxia sporothermodurans]
MKIHIHPKGITMCGKVWEIREQLKTYSKQFQYVQEWINKINQ